MPLTDITVMEKTPVTLKCETKKPAEVEWLKNGKQIKGTYKMYKTIQKGVVQMLVFSDTLPHDTGEYTAKIGNFSTTGKLTVMGRMQ